MISVSSEGALPLTNLRICAHAAKSRIGNHHGAAAPIGICHQNRAFENTAIAAHAATPHPKSDKGSKGEGLTEDLLFSRSN